MLFLQSVFISQREGEGSKEGLCQTRRCKNRSNIFTKTETTAFQCHLQSLSEYYPQSSRSRLNLYKNAPSIFSEEQHTCVFCLEK